MPYTLYEIAWLFLVYSFVGWLWETPYVSLKQKKWINRGFLRGPIIPIYGFAIVTVVLSMAYLDVFLSSVEWVKTVQLFLISALVATVWEYATSTLLEILFKTRWWDYSKRRFNLNGRVALSVSLFWGMGGTVLWRFINTPILSIYHQFSEVMMNRLITAIYFVLAIDVALTIYELVNLRNVVIKLHRVSEEVLEQLNTRVENITEQQEHFRTFLEEAKQSIKEKIVYYRYEGLQVFGDFIEDVKERGRLWAADNEQSTNKFSELLARIKRNGRFFKKYPDAITKNFQLLYMTRNKWEEFKQQSGEPNGHDTDKKE